MRSMISQKSEYCSPVATLMDGSFSSELLNPLLECNVCCADYVLTHIVDAMREMVHLVAPVLGGVIRGFAEIVAE